MVQIRRTMATAALCLGASVLAAAGCAAAQQEPAAGSAHLAIADVSIVDVRQGRIVPNQTVLISGDSILRIVPARRSETSATVQIDGRGMFIVPGLWDMHAHLRANGLPEWVSTDWMMPLLVAHGVTGVRDMNSDCDSPSDGPVCLARMREWQAQIDEGQRVGPRILSLSSWPVDPPWDYPVTEEQARAVVRKFREDGLDLVKIYSRLSREAFAWVMDEARKQGIEAGGHVPLRITLAEASNAGLRSIEHARDFLFDCYPGAAEFRATTRSQDPPIAVMQAMIREHDPAACDSVFRIIVRNRTWYVPTHVTRRMEALADDSAFRNDPRSQYIPAGVMQGWVADADRVVARDPSPEGRTAYVDFYHKGLAITGAAHRAGVMILLGTDAGDSFVFPGSAVHDELAELVAAGLSPAEALRAATWNGAEYMDMTDQHGSIEAGKRADLLLLDANPLDDIANSRTIQAVILGGRLYDRARLDELLRGAVAAARRTLTPPR